MTTVMCLNKQLNYDMIAHVVMEIKTLSSGRGSQNVMESRTQGVFHYQLEGHMVECIPPPRNA